MKSLERRFSKVKAKRPNLSSYMCFAEVVTGRNLSRKAIGHWFYKLVEKEDYAKNEEREIIEYLERLSKISEDGGKLA